MPRTFLFAIVVLTLASVGCSDPAGKSAPVTGLVTLNETPIAQGSITFRPVDAHQRPESADIENGEFSLDLPPGKCRVEVRAARPSSGPPVAGMGPTMEDYIPEKYKFPATMLNADIEPNQPNRLTFALMSDKRLKK
jgi:hypothetical protein